VALPFFGKKPAAAGSPAPRPRVGTDPAQGSSRPSASPPPPLSQAPLSRLPGKSHSETSSLDFTIAGGDLKRVMAQCADKVHVEEGVDEMSPPAEEAAILYANGGYDDARTVLSTL
jgi:hypothetical protein